MYPHTEYFDFDLMQLTGCSIDNLEAVRNLPFSTIYGKAILNLKTKCYEVADWLTLKSQ